jgi:D-lactate dehydrogenase
MQTPDVFFYEAFEEEAAAIAAVLPPQIRAGFTAATIQEYGKAEPPARIISLRTQSQIPGAWAEKMDALLSRSTGYDHLAAYRARHPSGPACGYLPLYCARAVAEQALLLWTALSRRLTVQLRQFNTFDRDGITGREIAGKTLLVAGVGNIGSEIVRIGQGLGMTVYGVDPVRKYNFTDYVELDEKIGEADIIVCAMNLTDENRKIFNYERLIKAKSGAIFINIARGELSPPGDLLRLLEEGQLGGAGLDVYDDESELAVALRTGGTCRSESARAVLKLNARDDVLCTPHNAFNTEEAVYRKAEQSVQQIEHFLKTGTFLWNIPE